jgi:predicted 3-demethylubiquinone-9 3-methyltransferase (glyoxalase superfamily)
MDSGLDHRYIFTLAMSIFVACDSEQEIDVLHDKLSEGGEESPARGRHRVLQSRSRRRRKRL